jgi:hypothetical protein
MGLGKGFGNVGDVLGGFGELWRFMGEGRAAFPVSRSTSNKKQVLQYFLAS